MIKSYSNTNSPIQTEFSDGTERALKLSIIIATYDRLQFIKPMLSSLSAAISHAPEIQVETILCINGKDPDSLRLCETFLQDRLLSLTILHLDEPRTPAEARNIASQRARGDWNLFLDDDVLVPEYFLSNFLSHTKKDPGVDVWGGPNLTPPASSSVEKKIGWYLENFWIVGPISYRYRRGVNRQRLPFNFHFSLCNLFVRSELFNQLQFKQNLKTAEENELIFQIEKRQMKTRSSDDLFVWHYRRKDIKRFLSQIHYYGYGRGQLIAQRCFKADTLTWFFCCLVALLGLIFFFPLSLAAVFGLWFVAISVQQWIRFGRQEFVYYLIPAQIWWGYAKGILVGFCSQLAWKPSPLPMIQNK